MTPSIPLPSDADGIQTQAGSKGFGHIRSKLPALLPCVVLGVLFVFYLAMSPHYRPYDIDDPWFLAFSYDTCVEHVVSDQFMNTPFPRGMDGTQYFGKLAAYVQNVALSPFGWQQFPAAVLSSCFIIVALACWGLQLRRLGYGVSTITSFLLIAGFSEPFLSAASKSRYEFLSFSLISLALLLVAYDLPFLGALLAALAVETQPVAIAGLLPVCLLAYLRSRNRASLTLRLAAAFAIAAAFYLFLHPEIFTLRAALTAPQDGMPSAPRGYFLAYFVNRPRHLPELICLATAAIVYWLRRRTQTSHYFAFAALLLTIFSLVVPHSNAAYMIFTYPFFVAVALVAFQPEHRLWIAFGAVILLLLPPEIYLLRLTRGLGYTAADIRVVTDRIATLAGERGVDDRTLHIYGDYRLWFAHPHFFRASTWGTTGDMKESDLFLCYDSPPQPSSLEPAFMLYCGDFQHLASLRLANTVVLRHHRISFYVRK